MSAPGPVRAADNTRADWETPVELFNKLDAEFKFALDAAATEQNTKCQYWLEGPCREDNRCDCGLCAPWDSRHVWLNPPYGKGIDKWIYKCVAARSYGATVVALLPANTDTRWFATVWHSASEIRFLEKRVQFVGTTSSNPGGSMVAVWRPFVDGLSRPWPIVSLWDWKDAS